MGPPREPAKHLIVTVDEPRTPAPQKLPRELCMSGYLPQLMTIILRSGGGYFQSFPGFPAETSNLSLRVPSAPWGGFNTCVMDRQLTYMRGNPHNGRNRRLLLSRAKRAQVRDSNHADQGRGDRAAMVAGRPRRGRSSSHTGRGCRKPSQAQERYKFAPSKTV